MKVFITGVAGFIGSNFAFRCLKNGYFVTGIDNFDPYYDVTLKKKNLAKLKDFGNFKFFKLDILDKENLRRIVNAEEPDIIVHLAARPGVRASLKDPYTYFEINIKGTLNILEIIKNRNIKFIFGSSSSVYGNKMGKFSEDDKDIIPVSPYGFSKRAGEILCETYNKLYGIKILVLRFFTVYGPSQRPDMAIHKFTRKILKGEEIELYGEGKTQRDYTYIDDIVKGLINALKFENFDFEIINLGNSKPIPLFELIRILEELLHKKAKVKPVPLPAGDVKSTYADIEKAKKILNYNPSTSLEKGIENFIKWHEKECSCLE